MLVLTRKQGETITIDGNIVIQIVKVQGRQVRVGVKAPKNIKVQRGELLDNPSVKQALLQKKPLTESSSFNSF